MTHLEVYRSSEIERARAADLMQRAGTGESALDVGAYDGHFSRLLLQRYRRVVALDLKKPSVEGCENVVGNATDLQFPDDTFDLVFCAEVLEHIPAVEKAARELARVAKHRVLIGVPYRQDTRLGRTTCAQCGYIGPPWGHVNEFDEDRIRSLFPDLAVESIGYVGENRERTNALATWLMDQGGNPWGDYRRTCLRCGSALKPPTSQRSLFQRIMSGLAVRMNKLQAQFSKPHGNWIHVLLVKAQER